MSRIIIIGGSGFLASHFVSFLQSKNKKFLVFDKIKNKNNNYKKIKFIKGSVTDKKKIFNLIKKNDIVYHFAAISDIGYANKKHLESIDVNIMGTVNILEACIKKKVKKLIFSSSIYARSKQGGFYSTTKLTGEMLIERYASKFNLKYNILRFGSLYGPNGNYFNTVKNFIKQGLNFKKIIRMGNGQEIRRYIHCMDAAKICYEVSKKKYDNKCFNIFGKEKTKVRDVMKLIASELNIKNLQFNKHIDDESHYKNQPFTYKIRKGINFYLTKSIKFKTGLKETIKHEKKFYKNEL